MKVVVVRSKVKLSKKNKADIKAEIMDGIRNGLLIIDGTYDLDIMDLPLQGKSKPSYERREKKWIAIKAEIMDGIRNGMDLPLQVKSKPSYERREK